MLVIYKGTSSLGYKGKTYGPGQSLDVTEAFYMKHRCRLMIVEEEVIEAEVIEPVEAEKPKRGRKKATK